MLFCSFLIADSYNMQLLGYLSYEQMTSDITGFYQDDREFAVVGLQNAASFVDITNPAFPFEVGTISGSNNIWRDLKYWDRHVYIGTEADDGIKVVSVDDPDNPILVNTIMDVDNSHNIHVDDGYLYIVGADEHDIWIYDLTFPATPNLMGTWDGEYIHDLDVKNDIGYAMGIYSSTAYIIDLSDKTNPQTLTSWSYPGMAHDAAVSEDGNYLVTADEMTGGNLKLWDIQNYSNINLLDEFTVNPQHSVHNVYIKDNFVYASYYADGTRVYDISTLSFNEVGYYDTSEIDGLYVGNWGTYVYLPSGNIISSDIETGLYILQYGGITIQHTDLQNQPFSSEPIGFVVTAESSTGNITSMQLYYDFNHSSDWNSLDMDGSLGVYSTEVEIPSDGTVVSYYFYAANDQDQESYYPAMGESTPVVFVVGDLPTVYSEDFESDSDGWDVSGDALFGLWELANPSGTYYDNIPVAPEDDATENGEFCYVTGNNAPTNSPGNDDVDGGATVLTSPVIDLSGEESVMLTYYRWYTNNLGDNASTDIWSVEVSNDSGSSWTNLESTNLSNNSWSKQTFFLSDHVDFTADMKFRFTAEDIYYDGDFGSGGSIVEAALDDILIQSIGSSPDILLGDINFDGEIDILDVVLVVNFALNVTEPTSDQFYAADVNGDGVIDVLDIVNIVNLILS
jgi:choice-of-anchor B domain-containing protein